MKKLVIFISILILTSCGTNKLSEWQEKFIEREIREIPRDTVINVQADSSLYKALIECQNGKPVIVDTVREIIKGKYVKQPKITIDGNVLSVMSRSEAQRLFFEWKEQYVKETSSVTRTMTETKEVEKDLGWWQLLWLNLGRIVGLCVIGYVVLKFLPWKNLIGRLVR